MRTVEVFEGQDLVSEGQPGMLAALLDTLAIPAVDLVGSDSGGAIAQIFRGALSRARPDPAPDQLRRA